jgi:hypothetical protein
MLDPPGIIFLRRISKSYQNPRDLTDELPMQPRRDSLLDNLYASVRIRFSTFMHEGPILALRMNTIPLNVRGGSLALLILAAITHGHLETARTTTVSHICGLGRIGRDLDRRDRDGEIVAASEVHLNPRSA